MNKVLFRIETRSQDQYWWARIKKETGNKDKTYGN